MKAIKYCTCFLCDMIVPIGKGQFQDIEIDGVTKNAFICNDCMAQENFAEQESISQVFHFLD